MVKNQTINTKVKQALQVANKKAGLNQQINQAILWLCKEQLLLTLIQEDLTDKMVQEKIRSVSALIRTISPTQSVQLENLGLNTQQTEILEKALLG